MLRSQALAAAFASLCLAQEPSADAVLSRIQNRITAQDLEADVSFLASDTLEGRGTPSVGLDVAAEFVASQFRRSGLQPAGDDGYFQNADYSVLSSDSRGIRLTVTVGSQIFRPGSNSMALPQGAALDLKASQAVVLSAANLSTVRIPQLTGKTVILQASSVPAALRDAEPALVILIANARPRGANRTRLREVSAAEPQFPVLTVWDAGLKAAIEGSKGAPVRVTAQIPDAARPKVRLKNVIGVLPGSDASLKDTYVIVSAHYDHLGMRPDGEGDRIFNGANDNASGTASLIEMANALAALPVKPKRSIVFIALFGEEAGEIGSAYYVRHPVFPLSKTVANINLEQLGRTDSTTGRNLSQFNLTGFDFTTLSPFFSKAAEESGVRAVKDEANSDDYFARSDNAAFAFAGVPSTTVSVTYDFPDYHAVGDEWRKIDYPNMSKVDAALALAVFRIADSEQEPRWNEANPRTARYVEAKKAQK